MLAWWIAGLFAASALLPSSLAAEEARSFQSRISLEPKQIEALKEALRADSVATRAFEPVRKIAERALHENPHPVKWIVSEGRLHSDPEKKQNLQARQDLSKIEALGYAYAISGKTALAEKARDFVLAWARAYEPDGNPINETEFVRLMKGYDLTRGLFSDSQRAEADRWLLRMAETQKSAIRPTSSTSKNNHHSHRLKIIGHVAWLIQNPNLVRWVVDAYKRHLDVNLYADGTTLDFHQRDALYYHVYDLLPLVDLALAADKNGEKLYNYTTVQGANLEKSIAFLIPYITGEKTHREFVHSTVKFDGQRSAAGDPAIQVGANWNPAKAKTLFDRAGYFQPRFHEVKFPGGDGVRSFDRLLASYR
jgi:alginate lyase